MTNKTKAIAQFERAYDEAMKLNPGGAGLALDKCSRSLRSIVRKASEDSLTDDWENKRVSQTNGPTYLFTGKLLADFSTQSDDVKDRWQEGELWITKSGAYIAVLIGVSDLPGEIDFYTAATFGSDVPEDARRIAVMEFFSWLNHARSMARDQLHWDLTIEVD